VGEAHGPLSPPRQELTSTTDDVRRLLPGCVGLV